MKIQQNISIIGSGKMGDTIISGLLRAGVASASQIIAADPSSKRLDYIKERHGVRTTINNREAVDAGDIIIFCVKPQNAENVFTSVSDRVRNGNIVISIMAGVTISRMQSWLPDGSSVIRVMPNTPTQVNAGMSALARGSHVSESQLKVSETLFAAVGRTIVLDEKHFDAVTGLSASGPAFIYIIIEALADGGVKSGLPRDVAIQLAAQMTLGAATMVLETGKHPAILKDDVTTPAGCTTDGILALEEGGVRVTLIKAVTEAAKRACELG